MHPMRIGIDARYLYGYLTGIGRYSLNLIKHLAAIDQENLYFIFKNKNRKESIVSQKNFVEISVSFPPISLRTWFYLPFKLLRTKIDLLHSHFPVAPLIQPFSSVITIHDLQAVAAPGFSSQRPLWLEKGVEAYYRLAYPLSMKKAKKIIAVSNTTKEAAKAMYGIPENKFHVIYEAVEKRFQPIDQVRLLENFRKKMRLPEKFILNVGNTRPHKNIDGLLKGFSEFVRINGHSDRICLVIAGVKERFYPEKKILTERLGISEYVHFIPYIDEEDLPLLYNLAELFIIVSLFEGFGLPPLEAMSCGTPVIASTHSALPEVLGNCALLVNPHDPKAIAGSIQTLLSDNALREHMSEKGIEWAKNFSWDKTARKTLLVYEDIFKNKHGFS